MLHRRRVIQIGFEEKLIGNPNKSPTKKLPVIEDGNQLVSDTSLIIKHLIKSRNLSLDNGISDLQLGQAIAVQRVIEESLYFTIGYSRWIDPKGFGVFGSIYIKEMPNFLKPPIAAFFKKMVSKQLYQQGILRYPRENVYKKGAQDLFSLSQYLGDNKYLLGDKITSYDAVLYAGVASIAFVPIDTPLQAEIKKHPNLVRYAEKIRSNYFDSKESPATP